MRSDPAPSGAYWNQRLQALASGSLVLALRAIDGGVTYAHCVRVGALSVAMAQRLDVAPRGVAYEAGLYHDLGKIAVPLSVLLKRGTLDEEERALVELHAEESERLLEAAGKHSIARHVAQHHERLDGSGYPHGRREGDLTTLGHVVAVADVYDALTHERPYRHAASRDGALQTIRGLGGKQFSLSVVDALEAVLAADEQIEAAAGLTAALALLGHSATPRRRAQVSAA